MSHDLTALYERLSHDDELQGGSKAYQTKTGSVKDIFSEGNTIF